MQILPLVSNNILWGNTLTEYVYALFIFVGIAIVLRVFQWFLLRRLEKIAAHTQTELDDVLIQVTRSIKPAFYYFIAFYIAFRTLAVTELVSDVVTGILLAWIVYQIIRALQVFIDYIVERREKKEKSRESKQALRYLSRIGKWLLWIIGFLVVLSNLGFNITSLVAGLGIGGVAVALALQAILGDLFSSFSIYFDKPFIIGDFIQIGEHMGTVERIGIKTTRLRAISGEEVVISNSELTSARVHNYGRITERRDLFTVGVSYETSAENLRRVPTIIQEVIEEQENARFDYARLKTLGDFALIYEVVYYVESGDYNVFMDIKQQINIKILERMHEEKITLPYPSQTLYLHNKK